MAAASEEIIVQNAAGRVAANAAGFLLIHWDGQPRPLAATCELFTTAAGELRRRGWGRILINQIRMKPFSPAEQQWISQEWLPAAVRESGYRAGAVVVAVNVLTRLATAYITAGAPELPLRYRSFDTEEAAIGWLLRQPR